MLISTLTARNSTREMASRPSRVLYRTQYFSFLKSVKLKHHPGPQSRSGADLVAARWRRRGTSLSPRGCHAGRGGAGATIGGDAERHAVSADGSHGAGVAEADLGDSAQMYEAARSAFASGDAAAAISLLHRAAARSHIQAAHTLGLAYAQV
eukprot:6192741-Pleurochrysis_carterae.AAC.2